MFAEVEGLLGFLPGLEIRKQDVVGRYGRDVVIILVVAPAEDGVETGVIGKHGEPWEVHAVADNTDVLKTGAQLLDLDVSTGRTLDGKPHGPCRTGR